MYRKAAPKSRTCCHVQTGSPLSPQSAAFNTVTLKSICQWKRMSSVRRLVILVERMNAFRHIQAWHYEQQNRGTSGETAPPIILMPCIQHRNITPETAAAYSKQLHVG